MVEAEDAANCVAISQLDGADAESAEAQAKAVKLSKNAKKKLKKKEKKQAGTAGTTPGTAIAINGSTEAEDDTSDLNVDIEYVADAMLDQSDPLYSDWMKIFEHFQKSATDEAGDEDRKNKETDADAMGEVSAVAAALQKKVKKEAEKHADSDDEGGDKESKLSRKKYKQLHRLSIAELKQLVTRPDVVEVWDVTASDPRLLVYLKSYRNSVPVPRHWCNKRKYLQGKRGIEKAPFQLPAFIEATGIAKLRQAYEDKQSEQSAKQRSRNASRPKMSKMDIDYQVLHDAFFKFQTKPRMTGHGDLYYEGKEFEVKMKEKRPGSLSDELKAALGMPADGPPVPPPWLINMQRYGPPPSYPNLKIPGLNAPIPPGAQFGYHPGGWGKPPVDELGRPIYGDVFGAADTGRGGEDDGPVERRWWGELAEVEEEEEEEEEEGGGEGEEEEVEPADAESGISSVTSGLATPSDGLASIELRKSSMSGLDTPESSAAAAGAASAGAEFTVRKGGPALYQVIQQEEAKVAGSELVGSAFRYTIADPTAAAATAAKRDKRHVDLLKSQATSGVEVTIDASELDAMDEAMLQDKYERTVGAQRREQREDVSDVFAEESRKRKKDAAKGKDGKNKKYKDYEF